MKNKNKTVWSVSEEKLLLELKIEGKTHREIAALLGRSVKSVGLKLDRSEKVEVAPKTYAQDKEIAGNAHWKRQYEALETKYERAVKAASAADQLVELARELAPTSYSPAPTIVRRHKSTGQAQSAVLMLSDTHVGQIVTPDQTLGFGLYNFETFLARLKRLEDSVASILQDHTTTEISELVLCLGGDMLHGALDHGSEASQHNTLFTQFYGAGHAIAQFIRNLSPLVPKIRIYTVVGNHPRWSNQKKMPTENRYSNLDQFLYAYIQALTAKIEKVEWALDCQPFAMFEVKNFLFHLSHGDHLRGGDKALGIPNHAVARMVSSTTQLFGKFQKAAPHYYLVGHMHRSIVLPHARGSVVVNGGFAGIDGYGLTNGFSPVDPSQTFFLVHPKFGKSATYDIALKFAEVSDTRPYEIPIEFPCV